MVIACYHVALFFNWSFHLSITNCRLFPNVGSLHENLSKLVVEFLCFFFFLFPSLSPFVIYYDIPSSYTILMNCSIVLFH
jgi:hypothetical protein